MDAPLHKTIRGKKVTQTYNREGTYKRGLVMYVYTDDGAEYVRSDGKGGWYNYDTGERVTVHGWFEDEDDV